MTIWALTLPQVAATLAATLVAYHTVNSDGQRMLDERMLNAVLTETGAFASCAQRSTTG
jgi:hypothetical protein